MKKIILFSVQYSFSQYSKIKFENIENVFTVNLLQESHNKVQVLISDDKRSGQHVSFLLEENYSQSTFVEKVVDNMKKIAETYYYKVNDSINIGIKNLDLIYEKFELTKPKKEVISNLVKLKLVFNSGDYVKNVDSILKDSNIPNSVFKDSDEYKFERGTENNINVIFKDSIRFKANSERELIDGIENNYSDIKEGVKKLFISEERFNEIFELKLNEDFRSQLAEIYNETLEDSDYSFINNVILTDSIAKKDIVFNINIKNNHELKFYNLKFCDEYYKCKKSIKILYSTEKTTFKKIVNNFIKSINENYTELDEDYMAELYLVVRSLNERSIISDAAKPFNKKIDSLVQAIENLETKYSGMLKLNKEIRVYKKYSLAVVEDTTFIIEYATVRFFNNKAKEVVVVGKLSSGSREFTVTNVQFSVPLRSFRNSLSFVPISPKDKDARSLYLNYNDLFEYYPKDGSSNYSARNKDYKIVADSTIAIEERKLMDYFTAVVFADFLGLNNQNANSLLQAEGRIKIPLWIRNFRKASFFSSLYADINATIYNGFDDNSRFITPVEVELNPNNDNNLISATINNFDYIKYNNVNAGMGIDFLNIELKGLSTEWSVGYGLRYFRAGLKHTEIDNGMDEVSRYQLNALSHELSTNFEIRPQLNFGADLNIAMNWLNGRGSVENLNVLYNQENDNDKREVLRLQLNLYSKLNPNESNGGVYARIGGFYHLGAKDFYPQILVGYATNLSSFVNKFAKK